MSISFNLLGQRVSTDGRLKVYANAKKGYVPVTLPSSGIAQIAKQKPNLETVKAEVERIQNEFSNSLGRKVQFNVDQELDRVVVMIVDPSTNKVIKEIPSEDVQKLHVRMEQACAMLIDELV